MKTYVLSGMNTMFICDYILLRIAVILWPAPNMLLSKCLALKNVVCFYFFKRFYVREQIARCLESGSRGSYESTSVTVDKLSCYRISPTE